MQGIKFNTQAILDNRKSQTRRPIKEAKVFDVDYGITIYEEPCGHHTNQKTEEFIKKFSKYKIGETVFVKEDINIRATWENDIAFTIPASEMTEKEARIFLKITNIKIERLQDISEEDCIKEGCNLSHLDCSCMYSNDACYKCFRSDASDYIDEFKEEIWNRLPYKSTYDWNSNPYVFVYEFERVERE